MPSDKPTNAGLQLFPPPPKKAKNPSKRNALTLNSPQAGRAGSPTFIEEGRRSAMAGRDMPHSDTTSPVTYPPPAAQIAEIPRSHTSFSEAPTLVRSNSNGSHTSRNGQQNSPPRGERSEPVIRSIFPRYNPEIPLEHQPYYPSPGSPQALSRTTVNRRPYSPSLTDRSPAGLQSPMVIGSSPGMFPGGVHDESILETSNNEEMKELWKVTNGWRVSASEGRRFCLKMTSALEEPVHTLSSTSQPFYTLRLDPTSTSAQVTMTRQDPNKPKSAGSPKLGTSSKPYTGMEVLATTLEEYARRLPPNDGLVALLYPRAAANMAVELANKSSRADGEQVIAAAERECGRLVWDEDSKKYYLVHPAMPTPFCISIHSSPAWSRSDYTLEHPELPRNLVRLTRDGSGGGYLEIDTAVASRIDCFYIVDVAICAVLLVAIAEEKVQNIERFEAPPSIAPMSPMSPKFKEKKDKKDRRKKDVHIEEFEIDLESQDSLAESKRKQKEEKIPGFCGLLWMMIKCFVWTIIMIFKAFAKIFMFIARGCNTKRDK